MKTILYRFIFIVIGLLFTRLTYAQSNYRPGYIVTLEKDTIYGEIDYRTDQMNAKQCVFQSKEDNSEPKTYLPFEIAEYRFTDDGKYYISKNIELKHGFIQPVFLEYLLKATKSLYYYEKEGDIPIYFIEDQNTLVKIDAPKLYQKPTVGIQFKKETDRYIPLLHYVFKDCPQISTHIDHIKFNRKDIVKIVKEYHNEMCTSDGDCIEFEIKKDKKPLILNITTYIGIIQYTIPLNSSIASYNRPDLSYLVGVTLTLTNKRWMNSISGCLDLSLSHLSSSRQSVSSSDYNTIDNSKYSGTFFSGKLGIRYTYPKGIIRPFAEFGADISSVINGKVYVNGEDELWLNGIQPGYYINAGINIKLSKKKTQAIHFRIQYKDSRDCLAKNKLVTGWAGAIGYIF